MSELVLSVQNLNKSFESEAETLHILKGINLQIHAGEVVAIQGPSGCGKSTLISIIAGLDHFDSGDFEVMSVSPKKLSARKWNSFRAQNIGIIFQQFHLLEHLTAFENVRLPLDLAENPNADILATEALEKVGLAQRKKHFQRELSRGECQRVAIARVLVMKPKLILADEPTASLDQKTGKEISEQIFKLAKNENIAVLMVTHDPGIARLCDRHYLMSEGQLSLSKKSDL